MKPGSMVILHLANPTEKYWGLLESLEPAGVVVRGINLGSFDDWVTQAARQERPGSLGLVTMFVPLFRVERIFLDEQVGEVESYRRRFQRRVGATVESYLGLADGESAGEGWKLPS